MSSTEEGSKGFTKKVKLRTASDVIARIIWDDSLPEFKFVVGYVDRFKGIIEKPFMTMDWSDPAIVDNDTLAIPKHRIMYFKYNKTKVWDRATRTDLIFGSTGSEMDIYEVMDKIDNSEGRFFCEDEDLCFEDDYGENADNSAVYENEDRPNFFVSARVNNEETVDRLDEASSHIKFFDPSLANCCIPRNKYHITLVTLRLNSPEEINDAFVALSDLKMNSAPVPSVKIEGLSLFQFRVLYACIKESQQLVELRNLIVKVLEEWKLAIKDKHTFIPHVTLVKTSRPVTRLRNSKYIDQSAYLKYIDQLFGTQVIDKLYLCKMSPEVGEDGFYQCEGEIDLT